jgi:MoaA/NifB/PqqE/SkfB family radical SAM enzyme
MNASTMLKINSNTCPAFFTDATINSSGSYSPCTALGGGAFTFGEQTFKVTWLDPKLEDARQRSIAGEKLKMCNRCWSEEEFGHTSERQYLLEDLPVNLDYTKQEYYIGGPRHINIKVSNICNLRCRTCQSLDSYLYHIEGEFYEKKHNITGTPYTLEKFKKHFTDLQLDELFEFSKNLERIELYGGEPFLDDQIPKYLLRLIDAGMSKNIDLFVSTNATHELTDTWRKIFSNFNNVIINTSIDGIGEQFTYMRHPGKWEVAEQNLREFFLLRQESSRINVIPVVTVSALNVWNVPEVFEYFKQYDVEPFTILVQWPSYYCVNVLPNTVKPLVAKRLGMYNNPKFEPIIRLMNTEPKKFRRDSINPWEEFKFWTREKDSYRNENFLVTFNEIGSIIVAHNEW